MSATKIEWCDYTINPVVGCSKCSPGCDNCYAERFAARMAAHPNPKIAAKYSNAVDAQGRWTGTIRCMESDLLGNWWNSCVRFMKSGSRIFVGSMTDLFHENVRNKDLLHLWELMEGWPECNFCVLTKRPERMRYFVLVYTPAEYHLSNVWLGVTVCNQDEADAKIPHLLQTPAAKRFVSIEPMLGPVDLGNFLKTPWMPDRVVKPYSVPVEYIDARGVDWVILGCETGSKARPVHPDWVCSVRDQCQGAGIPFFFKGWGEFHPLMWEEDGMVAIAPEDYPTVDVGGKMMARVGKKRAGRQLDGREWNEVPQDELKMRHLES